MPPALPESPESAEFPVFPESSVFPDCVPVLTDGVVTLRAHRQLDITAIVEQCNDPQMVRFTTVPTPYAVPQAQQYIGTIVPTGWSTEHGIKAWAIETVDPKDPDGVPRFAGSIDYRPTPQGVAEVGFGLHPWARGQHVMARAVRLVLAHAFDRGIETMHWRAVVGNWGSRRVAWACGFRMDGAVRDLLADSRGVNDGWVATLRKGEPPAPTRRWLEPRVLDGERVRLRAWREDDTPRAGQAPDQASRRFMPGFVPTTETFADWLTMQRSRSAEGESVTWCIADRASDAPLGNINCFRLSVDLTAGSGQVGYWLHPDARGQGAASEALELLVAHAVTPEEAGGLGLHRLAAGTDVDNLASLAVLRRAGFREIGMEHSAMAHDDGPPTDGPLFELLAGDDIDAQRADLTPVPVLETARLRLRPWRESDRSQAGQVPDADSLRFMPAGAEPTHDDFDAWLATRQRRALIAGDRYWCVADRDSDAALGMVQLFQLGPAAQPFQAEVGYWLFRPARGSNVIAEALPVVIDHAFAPVADGGLGLTRLHAGTDRDNVASQLVLTGAGFRRWGVDHQSLRRADGSWADGAFFELLTHDGTAAAVSTGGRSSYGRQEVLEGARICLRPFTTHDLPRMAELLRHDDVGPSGNPDADESHAGVWLARHHERRMSGAGLTWAIAEQNGDRPVGYVSAFRMNDGFHVDGCEVGYWIEPCSRGNGYVHEALELLLTHLFARREAGGLGLRRVRAITSPENTASQAVLTRAGFRQWGREPEAVEPGSPGPQPTASQGPAPSPDRLLFAVTRDVDRSAAAAATEATALTAVTIEGQTSRGRQIRLRAWHDDDAQRVAEACSDPASTHWLAGLPSPYTLAHAHAYISDSRLAQQQGRTLFWCVADVVTDRCAGSIAIMGLADDDPTSGEVGYWTHPDARGHGVMAEATRLAVRHAFIPREDGGLGLRRLRLNVADGNDASAAIARRNGFVEVGRDRLAELLGDGSQVDLIRFDQLASEFSPVARN